MKACCVSVIAALATVATLFIGPSPLVAQSASGVPEKSPFAGTWEGKMNDIPGIALKIDETGGKVSGTIVFYYQERSNTNDQWHVAGESPVPLLAPHVRGRLSHLKFSTTNVTSARNSVRTSSSAWRLRGPTKRACGSWNRKTPQRIWDQA
jgi:hypothetical protein